MAKARSTTTGASVRARAAAKPRSARATARPVSKSAVKPHKRHRLLGFLATMFALLALAGAAARALPADLPGTAICADCGIGNAMVHVAWLDCPAVGHRVAAYPCRTNRHRRNRMQWLLAISVLLLDRSTPQAAQNAVAAASPNTSDAYARVMTFNVYKGQADPQAIVELVAISASKCLLCRSPPRISSKNSMRLVLSIICRMRRSHRLTAYSVTASGRPRHLPIRPTMT